MIRHWLEVQDDEGNNLLTVRANGSVEYGPTYTPETAEAAFDEYQRINRVGFFDTIEPITFTAVQIKTPIRR